MQSPRRTARILALATCVVVAFYYLTAQNPDDSSSNNFLNGRKHGILGLDHVVKTGFDWAQLPLRYPVETIVPFPTGKLGGLPRIQYEFSPELQSEKKQRLLRRKAIRQAFQKCWRNYRKLAWMRDELSPISGTGKDTFGGWAATLVDSLDTLWIMDFKKEFAEAVRAVAKIDWANTNDTAANIFETTIRHLGGLLSAYDLSQEEVLLVKAVELGDMLYAGFDTPNRMPGFWLDFEKAKNGQLVADTHQPSASVCSLSLEFTQLSQVTGNSKYYDAITRITKVLEKSQNSTLLPGMWPTHLNTQTGVFNEGNAFTLGALADSLYEYLPKMHALLGDLDPIYSKLSLLTLETIKTHILFRPMTPNKADILFPGNVYVEDSIIRLDPEGQHLGCFVGGMFALSGRLFNNPEYVSIGEKLTRGSIWAYSSFPTGLMPEYFNLIPCKSQAGCEWDEARWEQEGEKTLAKGFKSARVPSYILRPEAIESVFILYRITGKDEYREAAWTMWEAVMKATETEFGNAAIEDVRALGKTIKRDSMESFWMAETLKYFYLIFSEPDMISLDDYVLNTEAHSFKRTK